MSAEARSPHGFPALARFARARTREGLALALAATLAAPAAQGAEPHVVELPPPVCDVCAPGQPPPPPHVQEELRRLNRDVNWRKAPDTGDVIPLGSATRIWFARAWASGRLKPGVANVGGGAGGARGVSLVRPNVQRAPRASLASRSRSRLADRSTLGGGRSRSSQSSRMESSMATSGRSSFSTGSSLGTNRSANPFGRGGSTFGRGSFDNSME